ncbi:MAG: helix-turn-helix transcriptional regulator [Nitrolancea sp.]
MAKIQLRKATDVLADQLESPDVRAEWDRTAPARAVAHRVLAYRVEHGLSQTALGKLLGMPQPAIARIESGEHVPTIDTLVRLSDGLGIEFSLNIVPPSKEAALISDEVQRAPVVEEAATIHGGRLLLAAR